jgi:hypothetical protein
MGDKGNYERTLGRVRIKIRPKTMELVRLKS